ncbi:MAG: hypothetical protein ACREPG_12105 [Candidatus Binatia bacterium]
MQKSASAAVFKSYDQPQTKLFSLPTPYMEQGRVTQLVAETASLSPDYSRYEVNARHCVDRGATL